MRYLLFRALLLLVTAFPCAASEVYLFQAHADGPPVSDPAVAGAVFVEWDTDAFFFNHGATEATVTLLDADAGMEFSIPPQKAVALSTALPARPLHLVHAIVPDAVTVENALFIGSAQGGTRPIAPTYEYGKVRLPVFTSLTLANQPQVHLATYLGNQPSHANVWIYNGGDEAATAHIVIRRQCDDAVVDETTVSVDAKNAVSVSGLAAVVPTCPSSATTRAWIVRSVYTTVTVDQPSLSFVSSVANDQIPRALVSVN
jgi:hypothetical protein